MAPDGKWYRHRIVKRLLLPGLRMIDWPNSQSHHPDVETAKKTLRQRADAEMSIYLRSHHHGQTLVTEFVKPRSGGVEIFVVQTLYGPQSVEDEIISELAERGEA